MTLLKQKQPQLNNAVRKKVSTGIRAEDYNQKWYIYELGTATSEEDGTDIVGEQTQSEFVDNLLGSITSGATNLANIFIKPAKYFTSDDGEEGVMYIKMDTKRRIGTPDIDNFLPKFIFKEMIEGYTGKQFPSRNKVYFMMREKPTATALGKIEHDEVYLLYNYDDIFNDDKDSTFGQTKISMIRFDSNTAKTSADEYLSVQFWVGATIPTADSLLFRPTTLAALPPTWMEIIDNEGSVKTISFSSDPNPDVENSATKWHLDHLAFKKPSGGFNFTMYSYMQSELLARKEMHKALTEENVVEDSVLLQFGSFSGESQNELWIQTVDYSYINTEGIIGIGSGIMDDEFVEAVTKTWYTGGFDSVLTQLGSSTITEEDGIIEGFSRNRENWSSQSRWWLSDTWIGKENVVVAAQHEIDISDTIRNKDVFSDESREGFINAFLNGNASIDGNNPILAFDNPITETFVSDIESVDSNYGMCIVNYGNDNLRNNAFEGTIFSYEEIQITTQTFAANPRMKIPNFADSLGAGVRLKKSLFEGYNTAPEYEPEKSGILASWGSSVQLASITLKGIFGSFWLKFLDNGQLATGVNADGESVIIPESLFRGPQAVSTPDATVIKLTFIA